MPCLSVFFLLLSCARTARLVHREVLVDASLSEPIEHCADRRLDRRRVVTVDRVQERARDQAVEVGAANLNLIDFKPAALPVAPSCGAASSGSVFPNFFYRWHW
jgi:hypothetical protein